MPQRVTGNEEILAEGNFGGSLVTAAVASHLRRDQGPVRTNSDPSGPVGTATKRKGMAAYGEAIASPSGTNQAINWVHWIKDDGSEKDFVAEGTKIWDVTADPETDITGTVSMTAGSFGSFVPFNNIMYWFPTGGTMKKSTGSTFANPTAAPASGNKYAVVHLGRIYVAGDPTDPSKVAASALENGEDWSTSLDAFNFHVDKSDGDALQGLLSAGDAVQRGPLYCFKRESVHAYYGLGPNDLESAVKRIADVGLVGEYALAKLGHFVFFCSRKGIHVLNGGVLTDLDPFIEPTYRDISDKTTIRLGVYNNQLWVCYDDNADGRVESALVLDFRRPQWSKYTTANASISFHGADNLKKGELVLLNRAGTQLYKMDSGTGDAGTAITMTVETGDIDLGRWYEHKTLRDLYIYAENTGNFDLTVKISTDGGTTYTTLSSTMDLNDAGKRVVMWPIKKRAPFLRIQLSNAEAASGGLIKVVGWAVSGLRLADTVLSS